MASTDNEVPAPIIIKKIKKGGHGHHGGAWKVAYADFVTAMMAFFLLMWLLNVTTAEEKNAISNYFDPTHPKVSSSESGAGGVLAGLTMAPDGAMTSTKSPLVDAPVQPNPSTGSALGKQKDRPGTSEYEGNTYELELEGDKATDENDQPSNEGGTKLKEGINILDEVLYVQESDVMQMKQAIEEKQDATFEGIKQKIYEELEKSPELADLKDHLVIDITPEGLRIQIVDKEGRSMFPSGKAEMFDFMQQILTKVTQVIIPQPNQISVRGHTDGVPYPPGAKYDNWNLSADRALASRRAMKEGGLDQTRIENVLGRADREHLLPDEPLSPRNRRISIVLLREKLETEEQIRAAAAREGITTNGATPTQTPEQQEDREDIPELDQTIDGPVPFTIENGGMPSNAADAPESPTPSNASEGSISQPQSTQTQDQPKSHPLPVPDNVEDAKPEPQFMEF